LLVKLDLVDLRRALPWNGSWNSVSLHQRIVFLSPLWAHLTERFVQSSSNIVFHNVFIFPVNTNHLVRDLNIGCGFIDLLINFFPLANFANYSFMEILLKVRCVELRVEALGGPGFGLLGILLIFVNLLKLI
jgi:hypothetical protein